MCAADASTSSAPLLTALGDARTILTCAKCKAAFPIDPEAFGSGRRVRCNNCDHEWYQTADRLQRLPESMELIEYPEKMRQRMREGKPAEAQTNFRVFVGNLPFVATEQELEDLFAEYGCVTGVSIAKDEDGRARGFGFINMEEPEEGNKAIEGLNGHTLYDRQLNVSPGKAPPGRGRGDGRGRGRGDGRGRGRGRGDFRGRGGNGGRGDFRGRGGNGRGRGPPPGAY